MPLPFFSLRLLRTRRPKRRADEARKPRVTKQRQGLSAARRAVHANVKKSRSSFRAGMMILPRAQRQAMYGLYAYCRDVDDLADDDTQPLAERLKALDVWRTRLDALYQGETPDHPIARILCDAIKDYNLERADFEAILDGMVMDLETPLVAPSWETLDLYCDRVASAVGRLAMRIFGETRTAQGHALAHHLGRALQLTNILRDLAEDAARGRLYLPVEVLEAHGLGGAQTLQDVLASPALPAVCHAVAEHARDHFAQAVHAMKACAPRAIRAPRMMAAWYGQILDQLTREGWHHVHKRVTLSRRLKLVFMTRALLGRFAYMPLRYRGTL